MDLEQLSKLELSEILSIYTQEEILKDDGDITIIKLCDVHNNCIIMKTLLRDEDFIDDSMEEVYNNFFIRYLFDIEGHEAMKYFSRPIQVYFETDKIIIISEYSHGYSLTNRIYDIRKIKTNEINDILIKISQSVHILEKHKTQHMDLHPGNIIIDAKLNPMIIDYGTMIHPAFVYKGRQFKQTTHLGKNINFINQIPRESVGYGMYTLIYYTLYSFAPKPNQEPGSADHYLDIEKRYPEYAKYFKSILDFNGLAFTESIMSQISSYSELSFDIDFDFDLGDEDIDLPESLLIKRHLELDKIKIYSGKNIMDMLSLYKF